MMDDVKLETTGESGADTNVYSIKAESPPFAESNLHDSLMEGVVVKYEEFVRQELDFQIQSEALDAKFDILNCKNIYIKTEAIANEEILIKTDQEQTAGNHTINLLTCEEQGLAEKCVLEVKNLNACKYKNCTESTNNESVNYYSGLQNKNNEVKGDTCIPKTSISNAECAKVPKILEDELHRIAKTHTRQKPIKCDVCGYRCARKSRLKDHVKIHTGEKPFKCNVCGYICSQKSNLKKHLKIHTGEKPFKCSVCNYKCLRGADLKLHVKIHSGEKPFKCTVCGKRFTQKGTLNNHMKSHTGEHSFKCFECDYRCTQKSRLEEHVKIHTGEKPFKCCVCDYRCSRKRHLKDHAKIHTGEKSFKCNICGFRGARKCTLKDHMKIHTGEKPFKCGVCNYSCAWKCSLQIHMKRHNGETFT